MNSNNIQYSEANGIVEIMLDRPEKRNALTAAMFEDLQSSFRRFSEGDARVAILHSCDDQVFSAGADLTSPPTDMLKGVPGFGVKCDKPIIAAISGKAIGAGLLLPMMCDFIVLTENAELIYPEAKIGVCKGAVTALLTRGPMRLTLEMMLLGDPIPAQRAYEAGMVNRLVPNGQHLDEARKMAAQLAKNAPLVIEMLKRLSLEAIGRTPIQTMYDTASAVDHVMGSRDASDALKAFKNKETPVFHGR